MKLFTDTFKVRGFQTDTHGKLSIRSLCDYMNEAAGNHCIEYKITVDDLNKIGLTWMLSRLKFRIIRLPEKDEIIKVNTWPSGAQGLFSCRDFIVTDDKDRELVKATSAWLTINLEKRRIVRLPQIITEMHPEPGSSKSALEADFKSKMPQIESQTSEYHLRPGYSALDMNRHVTSTRYIEWMINSLPVSFLDTHNLSEFEISYKQEILPEQDAVIVNDFNGTELSGINHEVKDSDSGNINCVAVSSWNPKS